MLLYGTGDGYLGIWRRPQNVRFLGYDMSFSSCLRTILQGVFGEHTVRHFRPGQEVTALAFDTVSPEERMVALAAADGLVQIWSITSTGSIACKVTSELDPADSVRSVAFTSDGRQLQVFSLANGKVYVPLICPLLSLPQKFFPPTALFSVVRLVLSSPFVASIEFSRICLSFVVISYVCLHRS